MIGQRNHLQKISAYHLRDKHSFNTFKVGKQFLDFATTHKRCNDKMALFTTGLELN